MSLNRASHAHGGSAGTSVRRLPCTVACLCSLQAGLKVQITIQLTRQAHAATHTPYGASPAKSPPSARLSASSSCQLSAGRGSSFLYLIHFIHHPSIPSFPYTNLKFLLSCPRNVFSLEQYAIFSKLVVATINVTINVFLRSPSKSWGTHGEAISGIVNRPDTFWAVVDVSSSS